MDPVDIKLTEDDLTAPDFPLPGEVTAAAVEHVRMMDSAIGDSGENVEGDPDANDWIVGDFFRPKPSRPMHSTRCVATVESTGARCRRWAVIGFTRCPSHSGYSKLANLAEYRERVLERARIDLLRGAPYAVEALTELAQDKEINPAVRLKASSEILDRVGIRGGTELQIDASIDTSDSAASTIRGRLERLRETALSATAEAAASGAAAELEPGAAGESEILDAELVAEEIELPDVAE